MPYRSRWSVTIPRCTLPTWIFGSPDMALLDPDPIFIDAERPESHSLSLHSYREWSQRLAVGLQNSGLQRGDRVLVFSENNIFYPIVFMGIIMAGGIFTGTNPTYLKTELAHQLRDSGAKLMFCNESQLETGLEAAETVGIAHDRIFIFDDEALGNKHNKGLTFAHSCKNWTSLLVSIDEASMFKWEEFDSLEDNRTICLNYSSGTTGVPKGVEITHYNYVANCTQFIHQIQLDPDELQQRSRDRQICFLPLYHAMAQTIFLAVRPKRRVPVWIMRKYTLPNLLENIERFRINDLLLVPPVLVAIAKSPITRTYDLTSVERVMCGAAPLGRETCEIFEQLWPAGQVNVKQGWGMTEATCSVLAWHPREISHSFSVGEPSANCEIKLVDSSEAVAEITDRNTSGEIWVRAPNVMKGYWHNPQATAEVLTPDGWLKTGDIGYVDQEGKVYIIDRKKELIKVRGNQVAPAELEAVLLKHPNIIDAAVVGVTIEGEEVPRAYIVSSKPMTAGEVMEYMKQHVSRIKYLTGGVSFIHAIPKNPSGKILRKILRDRAKEEVGRLESRL